MSSNMPALKIATTEQPEGSRPLVVDLDGSLIRSDLLQEAVLLLARVNFLALFLLPLWIMRGKAHLKMQLANRVTPNASLLPYRLHLLEWLKAERAAGRTLVLATASPRSWALAVADHLGLFDRIESTDERVNLSGNAKAERLTSLYGQGGYDYVGNSMADYPVWDSAGTAVIVGHDRAARRYAGQSVVDRLDDPGFQKPGWRVWLKAIRIHQWLKNALIFVPAILTSQVFSGAHIPALLIAFLAFSLSASSVYLLNDLLDIEADRKHRSKFTRPIPAGLVSPVSAVMVSMLFILTALAMSLALPVQFTAVLGLYLVTTTLYSFILKRMLLIDTLTLAGLFAIRVFAGSAAISAPISTWLLAFCIFFFFSLALVKRFVELDHQVDVKGARDTGRGYHSADLETLSQSGLASGFAAVVVLALYVDSPQMVQIYNRPELVWLICPLVLYMVVRIWILARRKEMNEDPVVFLMTDWRSQLMIAAGAVVMIIAQIF